LISFDSPLDKLNAKKSPIQNIKEIQLVTGPRADTIPVNFHFGTTFIARRDEPFSRNVVCLALAPN
jgi:hypothetical protein